jgi:hypothetical protein
MKFGLDSDLEDSPAQLQQADEANRCVLQHKCPSVQSPDYWLGCLGPADASTEHCKILLPVLVGVQLMVLQTFVCSGSCCAFFAHPEQSKTCPRSPT